MKFQFCGGINCPEWFIAQISVLTKITAVKMKLLFSQIINDYLEGHKQQISTKILKLLNGTGLDHYQMCAVAATLKFILENSVTFHVNDLTLNKQLIDLGLPKENVESISKTYKTNYQKLTAKSNESIFKISNKVQLTYSLHQFLASSKLKTQGIRRSQILSENLVNPNFAQINLIYNQVGEEQKAQNFIVCEDDLQNLIWELEGAMSCIQKIQKEKKTTIQQNNKIEEN